MRRMGRDQAARRSTVGTGGLSLMALCAEADGKSRDRVMLCYEFERRNLKRIR
jgi:hypothetical protein